MTNKIRTIAKPLFFEMLKTIGLVIGWCVVVSFLVHSLRGESATLESIAKQWTNLVTGADDTPGASSVDRFAASAMRTIRIVTVSSAVLLMASFSLGMMCVSSPRLASLRWWILVPSVLPAFIFPIFFGIGASTVVLPALCLAIGDMNLTSGVQHCYTRLLAETGKPYIRTAYSLGNSSAWELAPKAALWSIEAVRNRVPHLLGGTVAIEYAFNINGLGYLALRSVIGQRPELTPLIWIAGLGLIATRCLSLFHTAAATILTPVSSGVSSRNLAPSGLGLSLFIKRKTVGNKSISRPRHGAPSGLTLPTFSTRLATKLRSIRHTATSSLSAIVLGILSGTGSILILILVLSGGFKTPLETGPAHESPTMTFPLGTNALGEDVLSSIAWGGRQLWPPVFIGIMICVVIGTTLGILAGYFRTTWIDMALDLVVELVESIPKLIIILTVITIIDFEHYSMKLYSTMAVVFTPLLYRMVRDRVASLRASVFVEALASLGVSLRRILINHVLARHILPLICQATAIIVGYVLLFDAILGFVQVSQTGEVFTWGNILGLGFQEYERYAGVPGLEANVWIVLAPFIAVQTVIIASVLLSEMIELFSSHR